MFSRLHLRATPTRTRLKTPHRAELPFRSSPLLLHRPFLSFFLAVARKRWWRSPVVGARRIGEYRESKTEATRFRRAFFLVSRALRSLERPESCARPPARGCPLPFTTPRSESGYLCRSLSRKPFSFCSTHPTQNCTSPCSTMPCHTTLRHATPHYTAQNCVFTAVSFVLITKSSVQPQARIFMHTSFRLGVSSVFF